MGALLVGLIVVQQTAGVPGIDRFARGLNNGLHGCWFAAVTWLVLVMTSYCAPNLSVERVLAIGAGVALMAAPGTEIVQVFTRRDAGIDDVVFDLLGATAALAMWAVRARRLGVWRGLSIAVVALSISLSPFFGALAVNLYQDTIAPDLLRPGSPYYALLLRSASTVTQVTAPSDWPGWAGRRVLRVELPDERYPGVRISETVTDWRPYRALVMDVFAPGDTPLPLTVSVRFWKFREEHAYRTFDVGPGAGVVRIALDDLFDPDARRVSDLVIHSNRQSAGRTLYLGAVRLE